MAHDTAPAGTIQRSDRAPAPSRDRGGRAARPLVADATEARLRRTAVGLGVYAGTFAVSFGAVATAAGLSAWQAILLSVVMFSGASQFAFVGVVGAGGGPLAAAGVALLLGLRNTLYGPAVRERVGVSGWRVPLWGMVVIDETAAVAMAEDEPAIAGRAFRLTGVVLYASWCAGTLVGVLVGDVVDPSAFGLDAAVPVVFAALLWPRLEDPRARTTAVLAVAASVLLAPVVPAGVPVAVAVVVAVVVGWHGEDDRDETSVVPS